MRKANQERDITSIVRDSFFEMDYDLSDMYWEDISDYYDDLSIRLNTDFWLPVIHFEYYSWESDDYITASLNLKFKDKKYPLILSWEMPNYFGDMWMDEQAICVAEAFNRLYVDACGIVEEYTNPKWDFIFVR